MNDSIRNTIKELIAETIEGKLSNSTYYIDAKQDTGIFGTIHNLSLEEVNTSINGASIASHIDHTRYYLWVMNYCIENRTEPAINWQDSWEITPVTAEKWQNIKSELLTEYHRLLRLADRENWEPEDNSGILSALTHSAYHLGAIRQLAKNFIS